MAENVKEKQNNELPRTLNDYFDDHRSTILALIFGLPIMYLFLAPVLSGEQGTRYVLSSFGFVFLFGAMALTLNLEVGYLGLANFGKVAFIMIGAYTYAIVEATNFTPFGLSVPLVGIVLATIVTGFTGVLLTLPTLRLREDYFAIVTIVAGEIVRLVANNEPALGGFSGFPVTNIISDQFGPDDLMDGVFLDFSSLAITLLMIVISGLLYLYFLQGFRNIFEDPIKQQKYALTRTTTYTTVLVAIIIVLNFNSSFGSPWLMLDIFGILFIVGLVLVKSTLQFYNKQNPMRMLAYFGSFALVAILDFVIGSVSGTGTSELFRINWYFMLVSALVMLIVYVVMEELYHSPFGRALRAIREDDTSAVSIGKGIFEFRLKGLILSNALTGFVAAIYAWLLTTVNPQAFLPLLTFQLYIMVIVGGTANNKGVIFGAVVIQLLFQTTRRLSTAVFYYPFFTRSDVLDWGRQVNPFNLALIIVGITLIVFLIYAPEGIFPEKRDNNEMYRDMLYLTKESAEEMRSNPILRVLMRMTGINEQELTEEVKFE